MLEAGKLARAGYLRRLRAGEFACREGEAGAEMYIILQGKMEVTPDGESPTVLSAGDFFGEPALLDEPPRCATARAVEDAVLLVINEKNFREVIAAEPILALRIMRGMRARLRALEEELRRLKEAPGAAALPPEESVRPEAEHDKEAGHGKDDEEEDAAASGAAEKILYTKTTKCPVCGANFSTKSFFSYKLRMAGQDTELRNRYDGFEPLLYSTWACPECYYANASDAFNGRLTLRQKAVLKEGAEARKQKFGRPPEEEGLAKSIWEHLLVLENLAQASAEPAQKARIWLRLAWLYDDLKDSEKAWEARKNALSLFEQAYFASSGRFTPEQEQQMAYLIGELKYRLGDKKEALQFWRRAVSQKGGNAQFTRQVQDRIYAARGEAKRLT